MDNIFTDRDEIINLYKGCELYSEASLIIESLQDSKEYRDGMYITLNDLDVILKFKLRSQFNRQHRRRAIIEEHLLRRITELTFSIDTGDDDYNDEIRIDLLCTLRGIHTATASAILTLVYPEKYAIIDRRNWRFLFETDKASFTTSDYLKYIKIIRDISTKYALEPQVIDMAIWQKELLSTKK